MHTAAQRPETQAVFTGSAWPSHAKLCSRSCPPRQRHPSASVCQAAVMEGSARSGNLVVSCQCENRQKLCLSEIFRSAACMTWLCAMFWLPELSHGTAELKSVATGHLLQEAGSERDGRGDVRLPYKPEGWNFWRWQGHNIHYIQAGRSFQLPDVDWPHIQFEETGTSLHSIAKHGLGVAYISSSRTLLLFGVWSKWFVHV